MSERETERERVKESQHSLLSDGKKARPIAHTRAKAIGRCWRLLAVLGNLPHAIARGRATTVPSSHRRSPRAAQANLYLFPMEIARRGPGICFVMGIQGNQWEFVAISTIHTHTHTHAVPGTRIVSGRGTGGRRAVPTCGNVNY